MAQSLITYFEDRRVLYAPYELEVPIHVTRSILDIRTRLIGDMEQLSSDSPLYQSLAAMAAACRKFLTHTTHLDRDQDIFSRPTHLHSWIFLSAIGELRGALGIHIAQIAVRYGIDITGDLATILPEPTGDEASEPTDPPDNLPGAT